MVSPFVRRARAAFSDRERDWLITLRRELHAHPELSWHEVRTAECLTVAFRDLGVTEIQSVARTGLVARIPGSERGAPTVAIRGDIDALPIQEETGLPYASRNAGVMHACGHDVHATWAIAAALLLQRTPAHGDTLIVLQPAEEVGEGATAILASGAIDGAQMIFGGHVDRRFSTGEVIAEPGPLAASADTFRIVVTGKGAHGARPHESEDAVVAAAAIVTALQSVVARRLDPAAPAVLTVGSMHAGTAANIIPERAELTGTLRATDPRTRDHLAAHLATVARGVGQGYGVRVDVEVDRGTPPILNPEGPAAIARQAAEAALGEGCVVPFGITNMGGEDFAFYLERMPGCFLRFGAREPNGAVIGAHSPRFHADEDAIFCAGLVLAECARRASS